MMLTDKAVAETAEALAITWSKVVVMMAMAKKKIVMTSEKAGGHMTVLLMLCFL